MAKKPRSSLLRAGIRAVRGNRRKPEPDKPKSYEAEGARKSPDTGGSVNVSRQLDQDIADKRTKVNTPKDEINFLKLQQTEGARKRAAAKAELQRIINNEDLPKSQRDKAKKGFVQDYLEIDYIISCHFYANKNKWYHLNNHIIKYIGNCPARSVTPYVLLDNDKAIIEKSIDSLSKKINIENKLFGWQFLKDQSGNLYSIDFNLRPFGGFDKGSYDTDVSDQNWISYIDGAVPPNNIKYTHSIQCIYKDMQQFGYAPWDRIITELTNPIQFEVKEYDNILVPI